MEELKLNFDSSSPTSPLPPQSVTEINRTHTPVPQFSSIKDLTEHFVEVQNNLLGEVEDEEFSEDYEEELMIK